MVGFPLAMLIALAQIGLLAAGDRLGTYEQYTWVSCTFVFAALAWIWRRRAE